MVAVAMAVKLRHGGIRWLGLNVRSPSVARLANTAKHWVVQSTNQYYGYQTSVGGFSSFASGWLLQVSGRLYVCCAFDVDREKEEGIIYIVARFSDVGWR